MAVQVLVQVERKHPFPVICKTGESRSDGIGTRPWAPSRLWRAVRRDTADVSEIRRLQARFDRMPADLWATQITGDPWDEPENVISGAFAEIRVENGPWHLSCHSKFPDLSEEFKLCARIGAHMAGYSGNSPVTHWLNRICPKDQSRYPHLDLRRASADECEMLIIQVESTARAIGFNVEWPSVAQKIRSLRVECGFSQEDLAEEMKIEKRRIQEHESGKQPSLKFCAWYAGTFAKKLGRTFDVSDFYRSKVKAR